jgi:MFS family permease
MKQQTRVDGSWRALLAGRNGRIALVLAGGVALYAISSYAVGAVLPALSADLHGGRLYGWVNTAFLAASILGSASAIAVSSRVGLRMTYVVAFGTFGVGSLVVLAAPLMTFVVLGRFVQGLGGGALTALAYVAISQQLVETLWARSTALVTAMWGVGGLVGPAVGGVFGTSGSWRIPFAALAVAAALLAGVARWSLQPSGRDSTRTAIPILSILLVLLAVTAVSAAVRFDGLARLSCFGAGILLLLVFLLTDARARGSLLPKLAFQGSSRLPWIYILGAVLAGSVMIETFVPLFGQKLGGLPPFAAGYLAAVPSIGWTTAQFLSSSVTSPRTRKVLLVVGPLTNVVGIIVLALFGTTTGPWLAWWIPALLAIGGGVGMTFPHLAVATMQIGRDDDQSSQASAGLSVVQLLSNTVFTALCGLLIVSPVAGLTNAQVLACGLLVVVAAGVMVSALGFRRAQRIAMWERREVG